MIKKIAILCSIFLNLCIVRWEPVAIRMTWEAVGSQTFTFYTPRTPMSLRSLSACWWRCVR